MKGSDSLITYIRLLPHTRITYPSFLGFACVYDKIGLFAERDWVKVTAVVKREYFADYGGEGPVLHAVSVTKAKQPKDPVISFV